MHQNPPNHPSSASFGANWSALTTGMERGEDVDKNARLTHAETPLNCPKAGHALEVCYSSFFLARHCARSIDVDQYTSQRISITKKQKTSAVTARPASSPTRSITPFPFMWLTVRPAIGATNAFGDCAYRKLRLFFQRLFPVHVTNVTCLSSLATQPKKIGLDVVDFVAVRPR